MTGTEALILTWHSLDESGSVLSMSPRLFREQLRILRGSGVDVVPLREAARRPGSVALTFDDGYENFLPHAAGPLHDAGFPATVFAVSEYVGLEAAWPRAPRLKLMSWPQLEQVRRMGIDVGSHTARHAALPALTPARAREELITCDEEIGGRLGRLPSSFAYPYGAWDPSVKQLVAARYECACTTRLAAAHAGDDAHLLPRIEMYYFKDPRRFRALVEGRARAYLALRAWLRAARERGC